MLDGGTSVLMHAGVHREKKEALTAFDFAGQYSVKREHVVSDLYA